MQADASSAISHPYVLTLIGEELCIVSVAIWHSGTEHRFSPSELEFNMVDSHGEKPLANLRLQSRSPPQVSDCGPAGVKSPAARALACKKLTSGLGTLALAS